MPVSRTSDGSGLSGASGTELFNVENPTEIVSRRSYHNFMNTRLPLIAGKMLVQVTLYLDPSDF